MDGFDARTYAIIGAAQEVHTVLGCGYLERVINYLKASGLDVGLLLNFGTTRLQAKRFGMSRKHADAASAISASSADGLAN